ncbi:hypothetical protein K7X08_021811 [Anisodus acutangulus]|uniref:Uncharacterized protein n=1 Tax=Anisodus acutangulus TaxID=402998 RepID=A0A9Q1QTQ2_9SOLA|nr:hypothetical protein K7X08_021811 [Anisodus acutangulus]
MPSFLPHRVSPPNKLVVLNQTCLDLPTTSSDGRKWGDDEDEEVADNVESSIGLQKGKAPIESQIADDMTESTEDSTAYTAVLRKSRRARNKVAVRRTYALVLNQTCLDLPTTSSEGRKWGDDEEEEVADNVESSIGLQKGKAPIESQIADDMTESTEDSTTYTAVLRRSRRARNRVAVRRTYARK